VCMHYMCDMEKCARLTSLALLVLVAHESHDPCMRNIRGMPRQDALRVCEASDPVGHYTRQVIEVMT
jgi:hypothetical protein